MIVPSIFAAALALAQDIPGKAAPAPQLEGAAVELKNGGRLEGLIVEETADRITLEVEPGTIGLEKAQIARISSGPNRFTEFHARRAAVEDAEAEDPAAVWRLSLWADRQGLKRYARMSAEWTLAVDSGHEAAHLYLGHKKVNGEWMSRENALRAQGYVQFEGRWIKKEEADKILEDRARKAAERKAEQERRMEERRREAARLAERERQPERIIVGIQPVRPGYGYGRRWRGNGGIPWYWYGAAPRGYGWHHPHAGHGGHWGRHDGHPHAPGHGHGGDRRRIGGRQ